MHIIYLLVIIRYLFILIRFNVEKSKAAVETSMSDKW